MEYHSSVAFLEPSERLLSALEVRPRPGQLLGDEHALAASLARAEPGDKSVQLIYKEVRHVGSYLRVGIFDSQ